MSPLRPTDGAGPPPPAQEARAASTAPAVVEGEPLPPLAIRSPPERRSCAGEVLTVQPRNSSTDLGDTAHARPTFPLLTHPNLSQTPSDTLGGLAHRAGSTGGNQVSTTSDMPTNVVFPDDRRPAVVLFTGAGASRAEPLGMPTMAEFFREVADDQLHITHPGIQSERRPLLTRLIAVTHPDPLARDYDLEAVIRAIDFLNTAAQQDEQALRDSIALYMQYANSPAHEDADWARKFARQWTEALPEYLSQMNTLRAELHSLVFEKYRGADAGKAIDLYAPIIGALSAVAHDCGNRCLPVFTTNYDRSIESMFKTRETLDALTGACARHFERPDFRDGFGEHPSQLQRYSWDPKCYTDDLKEGSLWIPYFKLHGSLGWRLIKGEVFQDHYIEEKPVDQTQYPVLIYPGATKDKPATDPFRSAYANLEAALRHARVCLVIGFSMRDRYIERLFSDSLRENEALCLFFMLPGDPGPALRGFLARHEGRSQQLDAKFGTEEALSSLRDAISALQ